MANAQEGGQPHLEVLQRHFLIEPLHLLDGDVDAVGLHVQGQRCRVVLLMIKRSLLISCVEQ
jgi:hypothetical protein